MNIITTATYVAGIFARWTDAQQYLTLKPAALNGLVHTNTDLQYPFYLLEIGDDRFIDLVIGDNRFVSYQTEAEARAQGDGLILYTIYEDYRPEPPWTDSMGSLAHEHLCDF